MEQERLITAYKREGETPLQALERFRRENSKHAKSSLTYAGRLDPMAEGLLLIVIDGTQAKREQYMGLDKVYRVEILFGVKSDTGDILGIPQDDSEFSEINKDTLLHAFKCQVGKHLKPYPPYSSRPVDGKPLFMWARTGRLHEIEIPTHETEVYSIEFVGQIAVSGESLLKEIEVRILKVSGDFRQEEIIAGWRQVLQEKKERQFVLVEVLVSCGSGTYMRMLAEDVGVALGVASLAYRIKRESVGDFKLDSEESQHN